MSNTGFAVFSERPHRVEELTHPRSPEAKRAYEVVKTIRLAKIDYENFIADMAADRQFLEDNAALCSGSGPVIRCLRVACRGAEESLLVVPDKAWVDIAALEPEAATE